MKKVLCFIIMVVMLLSIFSFSAVATTNEAATYEEVFVEYLRKYAEGHDDEGFDWYSYEELCYYYSDSDSIQATTDETKVPDYVLVKSSLNMYSPMPGYFAVGNYIIFTGNLYIPYPIELYVYTPEDERINTLEQAYEKYSDVVDRFFEEGYFDAELLGDMDNDKKLTVKDATHIQKSLAGITEFEATDKFEGLISPAQNAPQYFSDFNRDGVRNIKDATAIQKHIAGIEY